MTQETRIITAALPFVNNIPHLGNIIGSHLPADVFARYCRLRGYRTIFVGGTDEHGTAIEFEAQKRGITPKELCDKLYEEHKKIYEWFNISYDNFSRTSRPLHHKLVQEFFLGLNKNGFILEKEIKIPFCLSCQKGLADRYIKGTCPHCGYEKADGDQCEKCATVLNSIDLVKPYCAVCETKDIEFRDVKHLFLNLKKIVPKIEKWLDNNKELRSQVRNLAKGWIKQGIEPRCITRDLKWGVKVPLKGFEDKVFYVWFDNVLGYVTSTVELFPKEGQDLWKNKDVKTYYFVGKDNIPFHTIFWPGQILGEGNYNLPWNVVGLQYLNFEGQKFSKSKGIGIFADQVKKSGIPIDYWRFYLINILPETKDTDFSSSDFKERINKELIDNFGNFVNRTLNFIYTKFDGKVSKINKIDAVLEKKINEKVAKILLAYEKCNLREALSEILHLSDLGNQYFNEKEPWKTKDEQALAYCYEICRILGILFSPIIPDAVLKLEKYLNTKDDKLKVDSLKINHSAKKISKPEILFEKIEEVSFGNSMGKIGKNGEFVNDKKLVNSNKSPDNNFPLKMRVGKIVEVKDHPNADSLYLLKVDFADEQRQVVAGLKKAFTIDELNGMKTVFCVNLKKAKLRGEVSEAMVLVADNKKKLALLDVGKAKLGQSVEFARLPSSDKEVTFDEFLKLKMLVKDDNVYFEDYRLEVSGVPVLVNDLEGAKIC